MSEQTPEIPEVVLKKTHAGSLTRYNHTEDVYFFAESNVVAVVTQYEDDSDPIVSCRGNKDRFEYAKQYFLDRRKKERGQSQ